MIKTMTNENFTTQTADETEELGRCLAQDLTGGEVIALHGDLGAGKTVFARGLARGLGIDEAITSPTFTIVQEYQGTRLRFYHIDLYRLYGVDDALGFGLSDYLRDSLGVTAVEWPERAAELFVDSTIIQVHIHHQSDGRRIEICADS